MRPKRHLRRTVDGEDLVVDLERGQLYALNATAARIVVLWREGVRDVPLLARRLAEEYDVDEALAQEEASRLLAEARRLELLED